MKIKMLAVALMALIVPGCHSQESNAVKTIPAKAFAEKIKETQNPQILDVRTPEEYASQHLDNANNVNWTGDGFEAKAAKYDKTRPVFVYCMSGGRSRKASEKLHQMGFSKVYDLEGGILKWNAAGLAPKSEKIIGMCSQEYAEMLAKNNRVLVDFYAEWCAPCKKMTPYLLKMQQESPNGVSIVRLNADENKTLISEMKIDELPTLLLYENNKLVWQHKGFISEEDLKKQLK